MMCVIIDNVLMPRSCMNCSVELGLYEIMCRRPRIIDRKLSYMRHENTLYSCDIYIVKKYEYIFFFFYDSPNELKIGHSRFTRVDCKEGN